MPRPNKKAQVKRAAARTFRRHGYHGTSMDMLAADLQLNKGTLYHYYRSKTDILFDVIMEPLGAMTQAVDGIPTALSAREQLVQLFQSQLRTIIDWDDEVGVYFQERRLLEGILAADQVAAVRREEGVYVRRLTEMLRDGQRGGEFREFDMVVVRAGVVGMVAHAPQWYDPKGRLSVEQTATLFAEFALRGIELA